MTGSPNSFRADPVSAVAGDITVPGDKSISHRALMLGALADGRSVIRGFLNGEDCLATQAAIEALGVPIQTQADGAVVIDGVGAEGLKSPSTVIDLGNSGTAIRLMTGLLAGRGIDAQLTGDASLRRRPMERVAGPLRSMGANIETTEGKPPVRIRPAARLRPIDYTQPVASAQVKSAILLGALTAQGRTVVRSPAPSRDHTERMLTTMGVPVETDESGNVVALAGPAALKAVDFDVPADFSSAAFFLVAGCLGASDGLLIRNVGVNPTRIGLLTILQEMGGDIEQRAQRRVGAEPVADFYVRRSTLRGIDVDPALVPLAIDEFPILFVAAAGAEGVTTVRGAEELRAKESDRITVMATGLRTLGARVQELPDGLSVTGGPLTGGHVDARGDHRIAMSFAVASLLASGPIHIANTLEVATSFPGFLEVAAAAGLAVGAGGERA